MVDPAWFKFAFDTLASEAGALFVHGVLARLRSSDQVDTLFAKVAEQVVVPLGQSDEVLRPLREDDDFLALLLVSLAQSTITTNRERLVALAEQLVGDVDEETTARDFAGQIVDAFQELAPYLFPKDEHAAFLFQHIVRQQRALARPPVDTTDADLGGPIAAPLKELALFDARAASQLRAILSTGSRLLGELHEQIDPPAAWIDRAEDPMATWDALGRIAAGAGDDLLAAKAFSRAGEPGPASTVRRAQSLARASEAMRRRGMAEAADALLQRATALSADTPRVVLAQLERLNGEPAAKFDALRSAAETTDFVGDERTTFLVRTADAALRLGRIDDASEAARQLREVDSTSPVLGEIESIITLLRAEGDPTSVSRDQLIEALAAVESEFETRRGYGLLQHMVTLAGRIANLYVLLEEFDAATDSLARLREAEIAAADEATAVEAARLAVSLQDADTAARLLPTSATSDEATLVRLLVSERHDGAAGRDERVDGLRALLTSDGNAVASDAARELLFLAANGWTSWSADAEVVLEGFAPPLVAVLKAMRLEREGDLVAATDALLSSDSLLALRALAPLHQRANRPDQAVAVYHQILDTTNSLDDRADLADALVEAGRVTEAQAEARVVAFAPAASLTARRRAFRTLVRAHHASGDYAHLSAVVREWREFEADDPEAVWIEADALQRIGRDHEAYQAIVAANAKPSTADQAHLLAVLIVRTLEAPVAVAELVKLSDMFERDERIEATLLATAWTSEVELEPALGARIRSAGEAFVTHFPESKIITQISAPSPAAMIEQLRSSLVETTDAQTVALQAVDEGHGPLSAVGDAVGAPLLATWLRAQTLPLAYPDEAVRHDEVEHAQSAISGGVLWDSTTIGTLAILAKQAPQVMDDVARLFPGSAIVQDVADDVARSRMRSLSAMEVTLDPSSGELLRIERAEDEVAESAATLSEALALASRLRIVPNFAANGPTAGIEQLVSEFGALATRSVLITVAAARRERLAVFSDDRLVRALARSEGVPNFGIVALLQAMRQRSLISQSADLACRRTLFVMGGRDVGVSLSVEELCDIGDKAAWLPEAAPAVAAAIFDPERWTAAASARETIVILRRAFDTSGSVALHGWSHAVLEAFSRARGEPIQWTAHVMLFIAWNFDANASDVRFFRELRRAFLQVPGVRHDPLIGAGAMLNELLNGSDPVIRAYTFRQAMRSVDAIDQAALMTGTPADLLRFGPRLAAAVVARLPIR